MRGENGVQDAGRGVPGWSQHGYLDGKITQLPCFKLAVTGVRVIQMVCGKL